MPMADCALPTVVMELSQNIFNIPTKLLFNLLFCVCHLPSQYMFGGGGGLLCYTSFFSVAAVTQVSISCFFSLSNHLNYEKLCLSVKGDYLPCFMTTEDKVLIWRAGAFEWSISKQDNFFCNKCVMKNI